MNRPPDDQQPLHNPRHPPPTPIHSPNQIDQEAYRLDFAQAKLPGVEVLDRSKDTALTKLA